MEKKIFAGSLLFTIILSLSGWLTLSSGNFAHLGWSAILFFCRFQYSGNKGEL